MVCVSLRVYRAKTRSRLLPLNYETTAHRVMKNIVPSLTQLGGTSLESARGLPGSD